MLQISYSFSVSWVVAKDPSKSEVLCSISYQAVFKDQNLLAPLPNCEVEGHPLSVVHDCLFKIFATTVHIWRPSPPSETRGGAMLCDKDPHNMIDMDVLR